MSIVVGRNYGFDQPKVYSSLQVEDPKFYRSRITTRHIDDGTGQMPYGCEVIDADGLIQRVLSIKNSGE